ncbi:putative signal transducing protein [Arenimonas sp.]|uniref:putative signal transducing protein n=1 Tax=Arenimonas sp. TaxID=1872635 RepID=UPI002E32FF68|nr:DUF2007 domain-containing protein [Arenimonas sp.]HEX4854211.1 DUF2007 domain-containing protein [Arenimonas sp.]
MTVTIARYFEPSEAHVVRALLESAGLQATVADDQLVTANYPLTGAMGGVRVQVPPGQAEEARALVAAYANGELERELEEAVGEPVEEACPACGSHRFATRAPTTGKLLAVAVWLFGAATFPLRGSRGECGDCGHRWVRG